MYHHFTQNGIIQQKYPRFLRDILKKSTFYSLLHFTQKITAENIAFSADF